MPAKRNNTGGKGGVRPGAGRKKSTKNKGITSIPISHFDGAEIPSKDIPSPKEYIILDQSLANDIYNNVYTFLLEKNCEKLVTQDLVERYSMCYARYIQCERKNDKYGVIGRHPTTGAPVTSPYVNIAVQYLNQAQRLENEILQRVNEGGSSSTVEDDPMTKLFNSL